MPLKIKMIRMSIEVRASLCCFHVKERKRECPMSVQHILLAALLLAVPISMKYDWPLRCARWWATLKGK